MGIFLMKSKKLSSSKRESSLPPEVNFSKIMRMWVEFTKTATTQKTESKANPSCLGTRIFFAVVGEMKAYFHLGCSRLRCRQGRTRPVLLEWMMNT
jgi:hypothetical protein